MKKFFALVLVAVLSLSVLSGVGASSVKADALATTEKGGPDLGGVTLVVGLTPDSYIISYDQGTNTFTDLLAESCNCNIAFYNFPSDGADVQTKLGLMAAAGGDMPDICDIQLADEMVLEYGSRGLFIELDEYVNNPDLAIFFNQIPEVDRVQMLTDITASDGHIYSFSKWEPEPWNMTPHRFYINRTWQDKLGLETPTKLADLEDWLTAMVTGDPNGNGKADEIGLYGRSAGTYGENIIKGLMNGFIYCSNAGADWMLEVDETDSSKVWAPFVQDEFRQGLEWMADLCAKGLLSSDIFTVDGTVFKATLNADENVVAMVTAGSYGGNWPDSDNNKNFLEMEMIPVMEGFSGNTYAAFSVYDPATTFYITAGCATPEEAFRFGDFFYSFDISMSNRFGEQGRDWTVDPEILKDLTCVNMEAGIVDEITMAYELDPSNPIWTSNHSRSWRNMGPRYADINVFNGLSNWDLMKKATFDANLPSLRPGACNTQYYYDAHPENLLPLLKYTAEEAEMNNTAIAEIKTYTKQAIAEFITGQTELNDATWQAYLDQLDFLGLNIWLETAQAAYDRVQG